ncbi:MAG: hypothetical protein ABIV50_07255 [Opitutus sp.]
MIKLLTRWLVVMALFGALPVKAATEVSFWHDYTHSPSREKHVSFDLKNFKRGLFFGSCGPSTRSLRWQFTFDLAGAVDRWPASSVRVQADDFRVVKVLSGSVTVDPRQRYAVIYLTVDESGTARPFVGNGRYRIQRTD